MPGGESHRERRRGSWFARRWRRSRAAVEHVPRHSSVPATASTAHRPADPVLLARFDQLSGRQQRPPGFARPTAGPAKRSHDLCPRGAGYDLLDLLRSSTGAEQAGPVRAQTLRGCVRSCVTAPLRKGATSGDVGGRRDLVYRGTPTYAQCPPHVTRRANNTRTSSRRKRLKTSQVIPAPALPQLLHDVANTSMSERLRRIDKRP
jgi:hypothetical protein